MTTVVLQGRFFLQGDREFTLDSKSVMEATFKIHATELSQEIIEKIRQFMSVNGESEVTIHIRPKKKKSFPTETKEAYFARINRALDHLDQKKKGVHFKTPLQKQNPPPAPSNGPA